jgi:hypothetical protein
MKRNKPTPVAFLASHHQNPGGTRLNRKGRSNEQYPEVHACPSGSLRRRIRASCRCCADGKALRPRHRQRRLPDRGAGEPGKRRWPDRPNFAGGRLRCRRRSRPRRGFAAPCLPGFCRQGIEGGSRDSRGRLFRWIRAAACRRELPGAGRRQYCPRFGRAHAGFAAVRLHSLAGGASFEGDHPGVGCRSRQPVFPIGSGACRRSRFGRTRTGRADRVQRRAGYDRARRARTVTAPTPRRSPR